MLLHLVEQLQLKLSAPTPPSTPHRLPPAGSVCRRRRHLMEQSKLKLSALTPPLAQLSTGASWVGVSAEAAVL